MAKVFREATLPGEIVALNLASGYVPNAIVGHFHNGTLMCAPETLVMLAGYGRTLRHARNEAQAYAAQYCRQNREIVAAGGADV